MRPKQLSANCISRLSDFLILRIIQFAAIILCFCVLYMYPEESGGYHVSVKYCMMSLTVYSIPWRRIRKLCKVIRYLAQRMLYFSTTFEGTVGYATSKTLACECGTVMRKDLA